MWEILCPEIYRQRGIIEGIPGFIITDTHIKEYLLKLSLALEMTALIEPVTHYTDTYGWAGWIHWENSGSHVYTWERTKKLSHLLFFSVDIYTCKKFDLTVAAKFTQVFFHAEKLVFKDFSL